MCVHVHISYGTPFMCCTTNQIKFISLLVHIQQYNTHTLTQYLQEGNPWNSAYLAGTPEENQGNKHTKKTKKTLKIEKVAKESKLQNGHC